MGRLVVVTKCGPLNWPVRLFLRPKIDIDGEPTRGRWGANTFDLTEGQYDVYVAINWPLLRIGGAHAGATVVVGQETVLYYKMPPSRWEPGVLDRDPGHHPSTKEGVAFTVVFLVAVVGVIVLTLTEVL